MAKGISDAQSAKEKLWTDSDFRSGTIKSIRYMDGDNQYVSPNERKKNKIPVYGMADITFEDGSGQPTVSACIPCTLEEAQEYHIGQKAHIELVVDDED